MYQVDKFRGDYGHGRYRGDPGLKSLFSKVTGVVGNIVPGPLGALATAASRATASRRPAATAIPRPANLPGGSFTGVQIRTPISSIQVGRTQTQTTQYGVSGLPVSGGADGCPKGYKLNRTGYFLRSGDFVAPGSKCVRIRTRNFANGRALSKAITRASGFERMVRRNRKNLRKLSKI